MPLIGKENFVAACEHIDTVFDHRGKFVKKSPGIYFYDLDLSSSHTQIAREALIEGTPLDAGGLIFSRTERVLYIRGGSNDFSIHQDNPERAGTIVDFRSFADGTGIEIR